MSSILELMEGMKRDADEILGKGEKLIARQNTDDTFESIRRYAYAKVRSGEWTREESSAWIERKDKEEYAASEARLPAALEVEERVNFPDQGHQTAHGYKETDGSLTYPTPKHLTKFGETS